MTKNALFRVLAIACAASLPFAPVALVRASDNCSGHSDCDDGNPCTKDKCHQGTCESRPHGNGDACDDGNACTGADQCGEGVCAGTNVPDGTACDDLETCSGQDSCAAGLCTVPGVATQKIAFSTTRNVPVPPPGVLPQVNLEVYLMNPDGTGEVRLTENGVNDSFAALSPNGKGRIVFDSARNSAEGSPPNLVDLWLMRSDGSNPQYLVRGSSASWSPDSRSIAFHRSASGEGLPINQFPGAPAADSDIFVARVCDLLAGLPPTNITNTDGIVDTDASWGPDGRTIVFTRFDAADDPQRPTSAEVWSIEADGNGLTRLTENEVEERAPSWSNDGLRILYACKQGTVAPDADNEICVMNADGTGQTQLTFNTGNDATMSCSPDDQKIIFHSGQLFTMNPDGTGRTQITFSAGISQYADWGFVTQ